MGRLGIEGATLGFDEDGSRQALDNINEQIIERIIERMEHSVEDLMYAVDEAWVGPSAEIFKDNVFADLNTIEYGMEESRRQLYEEFSNVQQQMFNADTSILNRREGGQR